MYDFVVRKKDIATAEKDIYFKKLIIFIKQTCWRYIFKQIKVAKNSAVGIKSTNKSWSSIIEVAKGRKMSSKMSAYGKIYL